MSERDLLRAPAGESGPRSWAERVADFARSLGIPPEHELLLREALTHRSLAESRWNNERLEFLGDSVLSLLVSEHLHQVHPEHTEGQLTKLRAAYVSEPSLARAASALGLGELLAMAAPDEAGGGRQRPSALSDAFEAVLAALYLACGLEPARDFVTRELLERVDPAVVRDYKSRLQELLQERLKAAPRYRTLVLGGPPHDRRFRSEVFLGEQLLGEGTGRTKKLAEQAAAAEALAALEGCPPV